jgi:hypothetical protein
MGDLDPDKTGFRINDLSGSILRAGQLRDCPFPGTNSAGRIESTTTLNSALDKSSASPCDKSFYEQRSPLKAVMTVVEPTIMKVLEAAHSAAAEVSVETLLNYQKTRGE